MNAQTDDGPNFEHAIAFHRQGRWAEAEAHCRETLRTRPAHPGALHLLGVIALQSGQPRDAVDLIVRSLQLNSQQPFALLNLGRALHGVQQPEQALACFDCALQLRPQFVEALISRGNTLRELQRPEAALASFERALQVDPDQAVALYNRGNVLRDLGRTAEALEGYERALRVKPDFAEALNARANALLALRRPTEALASYEQALRVSTDFAEAFNNRGNALRSLHRFGEALASFERSIQLGENRPAALGNYAWALLDAERFADAAAGFARLLAIAPDYDYARGAMCFARLCCCDWARHAEDSAAILAEVAAGKHVIAPFPVLALSDAPELNLACARVCAAHKYPAAATPAWSGRRYEHGRIRLAYVSADFRSHIVAHLLAPLIERHGREQFQTIAISLRPPEQTDHGRRIHAAFDQFHDVSSMTDDEAAALVCELEIDIAVDVAGFTGDHRAGIFARRAAPVQVNYLGFPGSMGADYYDYIIADRVLIPPESCAHFTEQVVYLPDSYQVNHSERALPSAALPATRLEHGLPPEGFVFCCFNNSFKLAPATFAVWMRILRGVPGSVLWLAAHQEIVERNLRAAAAARDVAPERLIFAKRQADLGAHLTRYLLADLFLDTFPFNAHATASDALWYGVPVLTCRGNTFASRVAASLLHAVGLPDLITESFADYERIALELAANPALLAEMRARLTRNRMTCALFDTDRFRRHLESAFATMWARQQAGRSAEAFSVLRDL